jgi:hypothetical protein
MFVAGSDIASLDGLLKWWEGVEYAAAAFVILGCVGEFIAEFTKIQTKGGRDQLGKISLLVLICALAIELIALVRTNGLSGQEIAVLNAVAADARTRAANAEGTAKGFDTKISEAQRGTAEAQRDAESAKKRAAEADERAALNEKEAARLRNAAEGEQLARVKIESQVSAAETRLEEERKIRLELENSMAPRVLGIPLGPGNKTSFDELKAFAGTEVIFDVLPDAEPRRAAQEIQNVLTYAGWKAVSINIRPELYTGDFDGVIIEPQRPMIGVVAMPGNKALTEHERSTKCAEALRLYLLTKNWKARMNLFHADQVPANTIRILVGFKPSPFYEPDWVKQMEENYKKILQLVNEREKYLPQPPQSPN